MGSILAMSSQVARGSVGLSAIVPALQSLGHSVIALPTVLLSNHPGHRNFAGGPIEVARLERMFDAIAANGWLADVGVILTGYLPSAEHVSFAATVVERIRRVRDDLRYICDPVLGDDPKGLYINQSAATAVRDRLLPLADIVMPNRFELAWLGGAPVADPPAAVAVARGLPSRAVIATSIPSSSEGLLTMEIDATSVHAFEVARRASVPNGTGDLLSGLVAGGWGLGKAVAAVDAVIAASAGHEELQITQTTAGWTSVTPLQEVPVSPGP